jgi:ElaA protein
LRQTPTPNRIEWHWQAFEHLAPGVLYDMLAARSEVFVLEQQCLYADMDGLDRDAWHLYALDTTPARPALAACARILPPDVGAPSVPCVRIGRVLTAPAYRGTGLGRQLLEQALRRIAPQWPGVPMALHAQAHLQDFYGAFGFEPDGEIHLEDGIPHLWMRRPASNGVR